MLTSFLSCFRPTREQKEWRPTLQVQFLFLRLVFNPQEAHCHRSSRGDLSKAGEGNLLLAHPSGNMAISASIVT